MSFLAPAMLWGALAAGIPIALHFFYRSRYRDVPWAAMKFLLASLEQTSRRLRFQELLLLVLRVATLIVLALALSRPTGSASGQGGSGDAVDAVLLIDNSLSMGMKAGVAPVGGGDAYRASLKELAAKDGSVTRLDRAKASALAVIGSLPPHSTVRVLTLSDRATLLGPHSPAHLDQARKLVQEIELSSQASDFLPGMVAAAKELKLGPSPNKEVYLFSDMHKLGWEAQSAALGAQMQELSRDARIHLVHCSPRAGGNVTITGITPHGQLRAGERVDFPVLLRNTGSETLKNLTVTLEIDGKSNARDTGTLAEIKPGERRSVTLTAFLDKPGRHVLTARVRPDDMEGDNRFDQVIYVRDDLAFLVVDGTLNRVEPLRSSSFHVLHAFNPIEEGVGTPLTGERILPSAAVPRMLADVDVCLLVNVPLRPTGREPGGTLSPEFLDALSAFVRSGKPLLIFGGDLVQPDAYNELLHDRQGLLPVRVRGQVTLPVGKPWQFDRDASADKPFGVFRKSAEHADLDQVEVRRTLELEEPANKEAQVLWRYKGGAPAVVSRKRPGEGEVLLFATPVNDTGPGRDLKERRLPWYLARSFTPFMQVVLQYLTDGKPEAHNRTAGEELSWAVPPGSASKPFDLMKPDGSRVRLGQAQSEGGQGRITAAGTETGRAGVYRIIATEGPTEGEAEGVPFAVVPDARETEDLGVLKAEEIEEKIGLRPVHLVAGEDGTVFSGAERLKREWTVWLLGALLVMVGAESVLAWFCGRAW